MPLAMAHISWVKIHSWWAKLETSAGPITVAVFLVPDLSYFALTWARLACDHKVIWGSLFTVKSFSVSIQVIVLIYGPAGIAIERVLDQWVFAAIVLCLVSTQTDVVVEELAMCTS